MDAASKLFRTRMRGQGPDQDLDPGRSLDRGLDPEADLAADPETRRMTAGTGPGPSQGPSPDPSPGLGPDRLRRNRRPGAGRGPDPTLGNEFIILSISTLVLKFYSVAWFDCGAQN